MEQFEPTNTLEIYLQRARAGEATTEELLSTLVKSELYMPYVSEPAEQLANFVPLCFDKDGKTMAAVFTNVALMNLYKAQIKGFVAMNGGALLARSAPGFGVVINPGHAIGLEIEEYGIKNIVAKFVNGKGNV